MRFWSNALLLVGALLGADLTAATGAEILPAALTRPALVTPRAAHSLILGVARAGKRLVAVGEHGIIVLSDNSGVSWVQAKSVPVMVTLTAIKFGSATEGWATGHMGVILHTLDSGQTWQAQMNGRDLAALVYKAAENLSDPASRADAITSAEQLIADGPDKPFLDLAVDGQSILAVGAYGIALRSADGGKSWKVADDIHGPQGGHLYGLSAAGGIALLTGEQGFLAQSTQGSSFEPLPRPENVTMFGGLVMPDGTRLAFGMGGRVFRAGAGEPSWRAEPSGLTGGLTSAVILPNSRVLIGSNIGELALGDKTGRNFVALHGGPPIPITAMMVDSESLIITGPAGPISVPLEYLEPDS